VNLQTGYLQTRVGITGPEGESVAVVAVARHDVLAAIQSPRIPAGESQQQHTATASAEETLRIFMNRYAGSIDTYLDAVTSQTIALINEKNDIEAGGQRGSRLSTEISSSRRACRRSP